MRHPSLDDVLAEARAAGSAGRWVDAHARLAAHAAELGREPSFALASAEAALRTGRPAEARRWATSAEEASARFLSVTARAQAANFAGAAALALGDLDAAARHFALALELSHAAAYDLGVARALNNLAIVADIEGRRDDALSHYESAIPVYQRLGNGSGLAGAFHNMALALRHLRRLERADECEQRAAEHAREVGEPHLVEVARVGRAEISLLRGDAHLAEAAAQRAAIAFGAVRQRAYEADAWRVVSAARRTRGAAHDALDFAERAVDVARPAEDRLVLAECLLERALVRQALGDLAVARADATEAVALFTALGAREPLAEARGVLERLDG